MIRNRRQSERSPADQSRCVFNLGGNTTEGVLIDKSEGGIRVGGLSLLCLFANQRVEVETQEGNFSGPCRSVSRGLNGTFQVGVLTTGEDSEVELESILLNSYVQHEGQSFVCIPLAVGEEEIDVQLLNGEEATVRADAVFQMTRQERLEDLCVEDSLKKSMKLYGKRRSGNEFVDRNFVLSHEFGPPNMPWGRN